MKTRAHLVISGRVQGVGFRWFVTDIAYSLGLAGWAKNLIDGKVEVVFEGESGAVEAAINQCHEGPRSAIVSGITTDLSEKPEGLVGFRIRY